MLIELGPHFILDCRYGGVYLRLGKRDWWLGRWEVRP
jgi:hypothetical protein